MTNNKQMYDKGKVTVGLIIFVIITTFPFWYNRGKAAPPPIPQLTEKALAEKECVLPKEFMKTNHMQLLSTWRETVVRGGKRMSIDTKGRQFQMSLSNTCLDCHSNKKEFCDSCHSYASVKPNCWNCHIDNPKEIER